MKGKQRAYLRSLANTIQAKYQIGKNGIDDNTLIQLEQGLEAHELIKVHVLENSPVTPREACDEVCERINAEPVQVIGGKFVIYKKSINNSTIVIPK